MRARYGESGAPDKGTVARDLRRVLLGTGAILLVPLVAMRFSAEVNWGVLDFAVAGLLLALILVWAEPAVGIFGSPIAGS